MKTSVFIPGHRLALTIHAVFIKDKLSGSDTATLFRKKTLILEVFMAGRSLNKVMLLGHLGRDPEVRYTSSGKAVATFTLATSQRWRDQDGADQEKTEWHRIVAWGRLGEICGEYLSKGKQVFLEGRIQTRDWEDQDGNKRTTVEIIANDIIMVGSSGMPQSKPDETPKKPSGTGTARPAGGSEDRIGPPPPEDDIPF
jgi:single-strand DNA-binding protein